ncbi:MAG: Stp1/IreP family PP2C-type Ser/Thr phosphatase [Clostridia bacterium]|nr:Stp1/IreP family PP2C-type Ser/Thr phosphatase [Clostridia bacterium]
MRKFNLTSKVARRLADLEKNAADAPSETRQEHEGAESSPARQPENAAFRIAWRSDIGKIRRTNQDAVILGNGLAGIADGMGGHQGGEIASGGLRDGLIRETEIPAEPSEEKLQEMIRKINRELWEQAEQDEKLSGMGTTLTLLWPNCREMLIAQVGDSRAYLLRDGVLQQMTEDHSMVADMVRRGILSEEQAACHPMRNYITRAVGTDETVDADITHVERRRGDRWLICSDGLHALVSREDLCRMLSRENIEEAANEMLETALGNGGRDNISLVLMEDHEGAAEEAAAPAEQANSGEVTP